MFEHTIRYCSEPLENIEGYWNAVNNGGPKKWACHHRLETHTSEGEKRLVALTVKELKALGMYYNRPASELIFITILDHRKLHGHTKETRERISKLKMGKPSWNKNKKMNEDYVKRCMLKNGMSKKVFCVETKETFPSTSYAARQFNTTAFKIKNACIKQSPLNGYHFNFT